METLYIIDAYAQIFRAYHAIRTPMSSPVTMEPTNATYGFVGMLLKLLRENKPEYVAVATDVSGDRGTFRSELYPAYKANREAPPEDFRPQAKRCHDLLVDLGIPVLGAAGYEADDVIATVVDRLRKERPDLRIRIVSKDKDLQQLLEGGAVELYDIHKDEVIDAGGLQEKIGITPGQVIDWLALMGDTSDNVPGVMGIGTKTAAQLLGEYGDLAGIFAAAHEGKIKGKRRENLLAAEGAVPLSRELVTLRRDTPIELDLEASRSGGIDLGKLPGLLRELGFGRYQDEVAALTGGEAQPKAKVRSPEGGGLFDAIDEEEEGAATVSGEYRCVRTEGELAALVERLEGAAIVAVDTETTSVQPMRAELVGLSFAVEAGEGWYVPVRSPRPEEHLGEGEVLAALRGVLESEAIKKTGHNLKYDLLVLRRCGIELGGVVDDTMIASYLIEASRSSHSMDALALSELGHTCVSIKSLIGTGKSQRTFDQVELARASDYAAEDADISLRLREVLVPKLRGMGLGELYDGLEVPMVHALADLEWNGIRCDREELDRQREAIRGVVESLAVQIQEAAPRDFNPDSPKQLSGVLFNSPDAAEPGLGIKPIKKTKTGYSTDAETLEKLAEDDSVESPLPRLIVEYRQLTKLVNTYLVALVEAIHPETGRIHASFNQTVAATGRLSSSDPNLQNIPIRTEIGREIRRAFVADEGHVLISADYSQIELRLLAHLSEDEALIRAFREDQDIHRAVAAQIHGVALDAVTDEQRSGAKMVNFGIIYGITPFGLARRLGVSNSEAGSIIDGYRARFPGIATFLQACIEEAKSKGYVETMMGRRRTIEEIDSRNPNRRSLGERMAINSVVQGSAADLIKLAMVRLRRAILEGDWGGDVPRVLLQIHDELVVEAAEGVAELVEGVVVEAMEGAMQLLVPLKVEAGSGPSWYDAH